MRKFLDVVITLLVAIAIILVAQRFNGGTMDPMFRILTFFAAIIIASLVFRRLRRSSNRDA